MKNNNLSGKIAVVTGATRGIGKAILDTLIQNGVVVYGVYKSSNDKAKEIEKDNQNIHMIQADVGNKNQVKKLLEEIGKKEKKIDIVINNAGIDIFGSLENYKHEDYERMVATNVTSVFLFSRYSIPYLKKSKDPVIINISSRIGNPDFAEARFVVYGACKAAVTNFTVGFSKEKDKTGIRVNAVIPTPTKTDLFDDVFEKEDEEFFIKKGKLGKPEDVAELVFKLIKDKKANGKILYDKRVWL